MFEMKHFIKFGINVCQESIKKNLVILPDDLGGDAEARPLLARGEGDRLSLPEGLTEAAR